MGKVKKKAAKFIKLLSKKITDDGSVGNIYDKATLKSLFADALSGLPQGDLKDEIQNNAAIYKQKLKLELKSLTKTSAASSTEFPFNLYTANKHVNFGTNRCVDNLFLFKALASKNVDKLVKILENTDDDHIELRLLNITSGDKSLAILEKIMHVYFLKSQPVMDILLEKKKQKRCIVMAKEIRHFLMVCHLRHSSIRQSSTTAVFRYEDLVASLAAVYVDLCLVAYGTKEKVPQLSRKICKTCCYLTCGQPEFRLDILLQVTAVQESNADILLPFARKSLQLKPEAGNLRHYLKYVLTVRQLRQQLQSSLPDDIIQDCRTVAAPRDFLYWLKEQNPTIMEEIPEDRKFKKTVVTNFLLDDLSEVTETALMDILTAKQGKVEKMTGSTDTESTPAVPEATGWTLDRGPAKPAEDLFFIDTKGSGDTEEKNNQTAKDNQKKDESDDEISFLYEEKLEHEDEEEQDKEKEELDDDVDDIVMVTDPSDIRDDKTSSLVEHTLQEVESMMGRSQTTLSPKTRSGDKQTTELENSLVLTENSKPQIPSVQQKKSVNSRSKHKIVTKSERNSEKLKETEYVKQNLFRVHSDDPDKTVSNELEVFDLTQYDTQPSIESVDLLSIEEEMSDSAADKSDLSFTGVEYVSDSEDSMDDSVMFLPSLSKNKNSDGDDLDTSAVLEVVDKTNVAKLPKTKAKTSLSPTTLKLEMSTKENTPSTANSNKVNSVNRKLRKTKETIISPSRTPSRTPSRESDIASSSSKTSNKKSKRLSQAKIEMFYSSKSSLLKSRNDSGCSSGNVITVDSDTEMSTENRRRTRSQFQSEAPCTEGVSETSKMEEMQDLGFEIRDAGNKSVKKKSPVKIAATETSYKVDEDKDSVDVNAGSYSLRKRQNSESSNCSLNTSVTKPRKASGKSIATAVLNQCISQSTPKSDVVKKSLKKRTSEQADSSVESEDSEITFKISPVKKYKLDTPKSSKRKSSAATPKETPSKRYSLREKK